MKLTPREKLNMTLNHQDPGEVVVDLGSTAITGINANALARLQKAYGIDRPVKINEPFQLLGMVEEDLRQAMGLSVVEVSCDYTMFGFKNRDWKPWTMPTGLEVLVSEEFRYTIDPDTGNTYLYPQGDTSVPPSGRLPKGGYYFDNITRTFKPFDEDSSNAHEDYSEDFKVFTDEQLRTIEEKCNFYYNNTDYGMIAGGMVASFGDFATVPGPGIKYPKGIRDLEEWLTAPYISPSYVHEIFEMQMEVGLKNLELFKQACGNKIQAMQVSGTDFGTQRGPYISPDAYREFYYPYHKKLNDWIHENTTWKTFFHTCGSITEFLTDFHKAGVDILNPVQTSAVGMDPQYLKNEWGKKFVFWGAGVDTQNTLPFGTPEEVYAEVMDRLKVFAPGGGFVFNAIHNIQGQTPTENLISMFKAVKDYNANLSKGE